MISLLLGLGNVGQAYQHTRHNIGFDVLEKVASAYQLEHSENCDEYYKAETEIERRKIILALPTQFMNNSGYAATALLHRYSLTPNEMLVIVDDFNIPLGSIRIRKSGSDGGHNGLASIIEQLETDQFPRLRFGIGPLAEESSVVDFVLGKFKEEEQELVNKMIILASDATRCILTEGLEEAIKKYNKNPA